VKYSKQTIFNVTALTALAISTAVYSKNNYTHIEPPAFAKELEKHKIFLTCYQAGKMITYDTFLQEISPPKWAITSHDLDGNTVSFFTLSENGGDTMCKMQRKAKLVLDADETSK